jgi:CRISPR type III-B/RAMP module RAMP protein Cmr6
MIPLAKDTREAVGVFADKVENRSLLFNKMVLAKNWGHSGRFNDANRFNVLRACTGGDRILAEDRDSASWKARKGGRNADADAYRASVAGALAGVNVDNRALAERQRENALHLLTLLEKSYGGRSHTFVGSLGGRLLINMGGGVQENAGMALDRCFGLPFIPGTAIKGVARHSALWDIRNTTDPAERKHKLRLALLAFGFIENDIHKGDFVWAAQDNKQLVAEAGAPFTRNDLFKGTLSFLPAYPSEVPKIVAEVLTPHPRAQEAARGQGDPRPIFFPAVEKGSSFAFAIIGSWLPDGVDLSEVLEQAGQWLRSAITSQGIGAKTGAGYGWFEIDPVAEEQRRELMAELARKAAETKRKADDLERAAAAERDRRASLSPEQVEAEAIMSLSQQQITDFAKALLSKTELQQRAFLSFVLTPALKTDRKRWKDKKPEIWNPIAETASKLGIPLS